MALKNIAIYDTTLRDGTQMRGFSLDVEDKIAVAQALDELGIHYIEGGWPGSNPRDLAFFKKMKSHPLKKAKLVTFGATYHKSIAHPSQCPLLQKALEAEAPVACIFGKTWDLHLKLVGLSEEENLERIYETIRFLKGKGLEVIFDAEHFFDGFKVNSTFALQCLEAALQAGADNLTLCDTNGGTLPSEVQQIVKTVKEKFSKAPLGIHAHNDGALAVANSLAAVEAGVTLVQGTINGVGERCGNADLCAILPNLELKMGYKTIGKTALKKLTKLAKFVGAKGHTPLEANHPFVGPNAFTHKGGIHVSAVKKNPASYEHIPPEAIGNKRSITLSDLAGKSNIIAFLEAHFPKSLQNALKPEDHKALLSHIKEAEKEGWQFEKAPESLLLFIAEKLFGYERSIKLNNFFVHTGKRLKAKEKVEATVSGSFKGASFHTAGWGCGPVDALNDALRKALEAEKKTLSPVKLTDFSVNILAMNTGTDAKTRVFMKHSDSTRHWTTMGVSTNIIEASILALLDAFEWVFFSQENFYKKKKLLQ